MKRTPPFAPTLRFLTRLLLRTVPLGRIPKWLKKRAFKGVANAPTSVEGIKEVHDMDVPCYIHSIELKKLSDDTGVPREDLTSIKEGAF